MVASFTVPISLRRTAGAGATGSARGGDDTTGAGRTAGAGAAGVVSTGVGVGVTATGEGITGAGVAGTGSLGAGAVSAGCVGVLSFGCSDSLGDDMPEGSMGLRRKHPETTNETTASDSQDRRTYIARAPGEVAP